MDAIINRRFYSTETAELLADDEFADRSNRLPHGRARHLYRTEAGAYFLHRETIWQREHDSIEPLTVDEAADLFEVLVYPRVSFSHAFPDITVTTA